jgi:hypothetical protein
MKLPSINKIEFFDGLEGLVTRLDTEAEATRV